MTEQENVLKDLRFIRNGYKNLAENGADGYRAVGKGVDCSVEVKTNKDLYSHYVVALDMAISALEKQIAKKIKLIGYHVSIGTKLGSCPNCDGRPLRECDNKYCPDCGQRLDWSEIG